MQKTKTRRFRHLFQKTEFLLFGKKKSRIDGHRVNFPFCDFESGVRNVIKSVCDGEFSRAFATFVISSLYGKPIFILLNLTTKIASKLKSTTVETKL